MAERMRTIVGLGELLWDLLPTGKQLGGAPANFAYISTLLGNRGVVASRVGKDSLGDEAIRHLEKMGVDTGSIQRDTQYATGTVRVEIDRAGQPKFEIGAGAWDFLEWTSEWRDLAAKADAICFGSLAQRSGTSRATIQLFVATARRGAVRVFDVNLRQAFYSSEVLKESMKAAEVVKLNHEELPRIMELCGLAPADERQAAAALARAHDVKLVCVTRGHRGSLLVCEGSVDEHPGFPVRVADTIGAGDAFTAALVREYLRGSSLPAMNETANRVGAWVASQVGAMPSPGPGGIEAAMTRVA